MSGTSGKDPTQDIGGDKLYVEAVLNRHAQKLLSAFRLHDLAFFAANLQDYELVGWLRKERLLSARVDDFVGALKQLHGDFHWPFPVLSLSALQHVAPAASIESSQSSVTDQIGSLRLGKLDTPGARGTSTPLSSQSSVSTELCTQSQEDGSASGGLGAPDRSEDSGSFLGGEADSIDSSGWSDTVGMSDVDQISAELANRGPQKSDLKLRYLFQLLMEAGCLEWAMLVCIVLRDAVLFLRVVNLACLADTPPEVVIRLQGGLAVLEQWISSDCPGYRPFLQAVQCHIAELQKCPTSPTVRATASTPRSNSLPQQAECLTAANSTTAPSVENTPALPRLDCKGDRRPALNIDSETPTENRTETDSRCVVS